MVNPKYIKQLFRQDPHYFNHIEGMRALAAIWMMFYHIAIFASLFFEKSLYLELLKHPLFKIALSSSVSLDVFFIITGLVIGHSLIKEYNDTGEVNLYRFFVRRCARVYPLYLAVLVITLPFYFATFHNAWANLLQINNFLPINQQHLIWTWSLAVDFQFYVLFALCIWLVAKKIIGKKMCVALAMFFLILPFVITPFLISAQHVYYVTPNAYRVASPEWGQFFNMGFDKLYVRIGPILYGLLTAYLLIYHRDMLENINKNLINVLAIILFAVMFFVCANDPVWFIDQAKEIWQTSSYWAIVVQRNIFSLALCVIVLLCANPKGFVIKSIVNVLNLSVLRPFGQLTFSTYLLHPVVILLGFVLYFTFHENVSAPDYFRFGLWLILLCYLIAIPFYLFIEQPAMDYLKQKLLAKRASKLVSSPI